MKSLYKSALVLFTVLALTASSYAGNGVIVSLFPPSGTGQANIMAVVEIDSMMATVIIRMKDAGPSKLQVGDAIELETLSGPSTKLIHLKTSKVYEAKVSALRSRGRRIEDGDIVPA